MKARRVDEPAARPLTARELDRLRRQIDGRQLDVGLLMRFVATIDAEVAKTEALLKALDGFGRHRSDCGVWAGRFRVIDFKKKCTCGLAAALAAAAEGKKKR